MFSIVGKNAKAKVFAAEVDDATIKLIYSFLSHPASIGSTVRIMPDCHAGKGVVVGFTATLTDYVIPNVIGVDIGCGVQSVCYGKDTPPFEEIDNFIKENIPAGFSVHNDTKHFKNVPNLFIKKIALTAEKTHQKTEYALASLGTLGGGNHFIEIGIDTQGRYWLTVHTGSRNFGLKIANYHQKAAQRKILSTLPEKIDELKKKYKGKELGDKIQQVKQELKAPKDLAYLQGKDAESYIEDMRVAQEYAALNRNLIVSSIFSAFNLKPVEIVESMHNYIDLQHGVIRKGAISAYKGEIVTIPMNMVYGVVIGVGKGNPDWNFSAPHGAGRKMSRSQAKKSVTLEEFTAEMKNAGVFSTSVNTSTIDESPQAYKNPDVIIELLKETIEIKEIVRSVYNFKA